MAGKTVFQVVVVIAAIMMCVCACGAPAKRKPNAPNIPAGTYQKSCSGCEIITADSKKVLSCECSKACGTLNPTRIAIEDCRSFGNNDGVLYCDKEMENAENVPKGFYLDSCGGCTYDESKRELSCKKCLAKGDNYVESTLEIYDGCVIINDRGTLKCREEPREIRDAMADEKVRKPMPSGYKKDEL